MGQIIPFVRRACVFDPESVTVLSTAYANALYVLGGRGQIPMPQQVIAKRIIVVAGRGELDPDRLCKAALETLREPGDQAVQSKGAAWNEWR
jgi:hypothetical protein